MKPAAIVASRVSAAVWRHHAPALLTTSLARIALAAGGAARSTLVVLAAADGTAAGRHRELTAAAIDAAYREGNLRLSVHLFNSPAEIDRALAVLHADGAG